MVLQQLCCANLHIQLQDLQSMRSVFVCCYRGIYCVEWRLWCMYFWTEVSAWCTPIAVYLVHLSSAELNSGIGPCTASDSFKLSIKWELLELLIHAVNLWSIVSCSECTQFVQSRTCSEVMKSFSNTFGYQTLIFQKWLGVGEVSKLREIGIRWLVKKVKNIYCRNVINLKQSTKFVRAIRYFKH